LVTLALVTFAVVTELSVSCDVPTPPAAISSVTAPIEPPPVSPAPTVTAVMSPIVRPGALK
jgi:hypothetical protein